MGKLEKSRRDLLTGPMDDHPYYLRQQPNAFPVVPVSTLSAPIASSSHPMAHSTTTPLQLPTVADLAGEQVQFPTIFKTKISISKRRAKLKFRALLIVSVRNFQVSEGKLQLHFPPTFVTYTAPLE